MKKAGIVETLLPADDGGNRGMTSASDAAAQLGLMKTSENQGDGTAEKTDEECNVPLAEKQNQSSGSSENPVVKEEVFSRKGSFRYILLKRLLLLAFCSCILVVGIFCRLFVVHNGAFIHQANHTLGNDELTSVRYDS